MKMRVEAKKEYDRKRYIKTRETQLEYSKQYYNENKEKKKEYLKQWYQRNKEKVLNRSKNHYKQNKEYYTTKEAKRRAYKLKATPSWADKEAIKSWYVLAKMLDKTFNEKHHVDHIVPLKNEKVCGLHVEYNLQILTATENLTKGNKFNEELLCV